jgi:hypothetical protein
VAARNSLDPEQDQDPQAIVAVRLADHRAIVAA